MTDDDQTSPPPQEVAADPATRTWHVGRVGSGHRRLLTLGGATGRWVVTDDAGTELASAHSRVVVDELRVEIRGRKIVVNLAGKKGLMGTHDRLSGVDDATGATVLEGERTLVSFRSTFHSEEWKVRLAGATIRWVYNQSEPRRLGFYDAQDRALMSLVTIPRST
ncbi:MAG: hypothetical protein ACRD2C_25780 [Acidimicrobiales bacterium]